MRFLKAAAFLFTLVALAGCRSHYIQATITNQSSETLSVIQVDYPSASFGTQTLVPGQTFHYQFKIQGSGPTKLTWLTAERKELHSTGPQLQEGEEGQLAITIPASGDPSWNLSLITGR